MLALQSGNIPGDCTTKQLTYRYTSFCQPLDSGKVVRVVFCDVKKAFGRVWHKHFLMLHSVAVRDTVLRVILKGAISEWSSIKVGVPQNFIVWSLYFFLHINDITAHISTNIRLFAKVISLYRIADRPIRYSEHLNSDLLKNGLINGLKISTPLKLNLSFLVVK